MTNRKRHKIEWVTHTANPFTGCPHGCSFCYARRMAERWSLVPGSVYGRVKERLGRPFEMAFHYDKFLALDMELHRARQPRDVFLGSMSDVAAGGVWQVFTGEGRPGSVMAQQQFQETIRTFIEGHKRHTFYLLTKNPEGLLTSWPDNARVGVSATNMNQVSDRLYTLLDRVTAGIRWLSLEPLLEPSFDPHCMQFCDKKPDWVVVGALTGPGVNLGHGMNSPVVQAAARIEMWCFQSETSLFIKKSIRDLWGEWPMQIPTGCALSPKS